MNLRERIIDRYSEKLKDRRFSNDHIPRMNGRPYKADPAKQTLSFEEFIDSFFDSNDLEDTPETFCVLDDWTFEDELDHIGNVLCDKVVR